MTDEKWDAGKEAASRDQDLRQAGLAEGVAGVISR